MSFLFHLIKIFLLSFLFMGCAVKEVTPLENITNMDRLTKLLIQLDKRVEREEAKSLAKSSIMYAQQLSKDYELVSPPFIQNTLVNLGLKKRGLCYEWAEDMLTYLSSKNYRTLIFHRVGANIGRLNEHNALSVSVVGKDIEGSILLDAWRNSGNLYFTVIEKDKKYSWKERFY